MALDATVGGASANSYSERADADAHFADQLHTDVWDAAIDADKDAALVMSTLLLDTECYNGTRVSAAQAREFPRNGLTHGGHVVANDAIPSQILLAHWHLAQLLLGTDLTAVKTQLQEGLKSLKAGPVTLTFFESFEHQTIPASIKAMIPSAWLCGPTTYTSSFKVF